MIIEESTSFLNDLDSLSEILGDLTDDVSVARKVLHLTPGESHPGTLQLAVSIQASCSVHLKKIACRSQKGKGLHSALRLVYAFFKKEEKILLLELYTHDATLRHEPRYLQFLDSLLSQE